MYSFLRIAGKGEGIIIFFVFHFRPLRNIHLVHRYLYHFFLLDLFVITSDSWWDLISLEICIFIDAIKSEQSDIVRIRAHIKLSPFYYKTNALTNQDLNP